MNCEMPSRVARGRRLRLSLRVGLVVWACARVASAGQTTSATVLEGVRQRAQKISDFHFVLSKRETKYEYDGSLALTSKEVVSSQYEVVSQNGKLLEEYEISSSNPTGLDVRHSSSTFMNGSGRWIQNDLDRNGGGKGFLTISGGRRYVSSERLALDAFLGMWGHSGIRRHPTSLWAKELQPHHMVSRSIENGWTEIRYQPDPRSDIWVLDVDSDRGNLVCKAARLDPQNRPLEISEVVESRQVEGIWVPTQIAYRKYRYSGSTMLLDRERHVILDVITFRPTLSDSAFRLQSPTGEIVLRIGSPKLEFDPRDVEVDASLVPLIPSEQGVFSEADLQQPRASIAGRASEETSGEPGPTRVGTPPSPNHIWKIAAAIGVVAVAVVMVILARRGRNRVEP